MGFERKFFGLVTKSSRQCFDYSILSVQGIILTKKRAFFYKTCIFGIDFGLWVKFFCSSVGSFAAGMSHLNSTCRNERFGNENFPKNVFKSCFLSDCERTNVGLPATMFRQVCRNCIPLVHRIIFGKHI